MATWTQLGTQDASSPLMEELIYFHDYTLIILVLITILVLYGLSSLISSFFIKRYFLAKKELETLWTILPGMVLMFLALPSLQILYLLEETSEPFLTMKATGFQWFWTYNYKDFPELKSIKSYMMATEHLLKGQPRLMEVDKRLMLPSKKPMRVLISSKDVLHAWTVPSLGIKMDAVPGRLKQVSFFLDRPGLFYGQCSEICGANHSFMPMVMESVPYLYFSNWISKNLKN